MDGISITTASLVLHRTPRDGSGSVQTCESGCSASRFKAKTNLSITCSGWGPPKGFAVSASFKLPSLWLPSASKCTWWGEMLFQVRCSFLTIFADDWPLTVPSTAWKTANVAVDFGIIVPSFWSLRPQPDWNCNGELHFHSLRFASLPVSFSPSLLLAPSPTLALSGSRSPRLFLSSRFVSTQKLTFLRFLEFAGDGSGGWNVDQFGHGLPSGYPSPWLYYGKDFLWGPPKGFQVDVSFRFPSLFLQKAALFKWFSEQLLFCSRKVTRYVLTSLSFPSYSSQPFLGGRSSQRGLPLPSS